MSDLALVTGASGFIGYHLVRTLVEHNVRVRCLVRESSSISQLPLDQVEIEYGDVLNLESLKRAARDVSTVYHLAGNIDATNLELLYAVNVEGARNIAEACAAQPDPPVLIFVSSLEAGGPAINGLPRNEQHPPDPVTHYGRSKIKGEQAAAELAVQVPTTIVRAPVVFGAHDRESLNVFKAFQIGRVGLYPLPGANSLRISLIHAEDLSEFLLLAAKNGQRHKPEGSIGNGIYYTAYKDQPTFAELIKMAAESLHYEQVRIIEIPIAAVWVAGALAELWARLRGRPAGILNLDKARAAAAGSWICSAEKSVGLGFSPRHSLSERIQMTAHWYQQHDWL